MKKKNYVKKVKGLISLFLVALLLLVERFRLRTSLRITKLLGRTRMGKQKVTTYSPS